MLTTSPPSRAECHEIWEPKPPRTLWATPALLRDVIVLYTPTFLSFFVNGPLRPKLVANSRITIKCYTVVSDGVHI